MSDPSVILAINGGSTSIKCTAYINGDRGRPLQTFLSVQYGHSGTSAAHFPAIAGELTERSAQSEIQTITEAIDQLMNWLARHLGHMTIDAIGHRVVRGPGNEEAVFIDEDILIALRLLYPYDPEHVPVEIQLIDAFRERYPGIPQVACYDTAFHRSMPEIASLLPLPGRYEGSGLRRYGYHGLSCTHVLEALRQLTYSHGMPERVIVAHLGGGSSVTAVLKGRCIDTSMGFTPAGGLPMGTRTGDIDPGIAYHLVYQEKLDASTFNRLVNHESGLKGISGISGDMQELLEQEHLYPAAAKAIAYYCYQVKKYIGAYAAALGGLDALVFTGGIGEKAASIRSRICEGLGFLGHFSLYVIHSDEEQVIARHTIRLL